MQDDFYIGRDWLVQPSLNRISNSQKSHRLTKKYMQVLLCLADRAGETISRQELMDAVWEQTIVGEESLTRAISELRKVFDDPPGDARIIETIPKVGYRLIAPVTSVSDSGTRRLPANLSTSGKKIVGPVAVVAVLILTAMMLGIVGYLSHSFSPAAQPAPRTLPVTSYPGLESQPALSPDGKRVAFVSEDARGANHDLYVKGMSGEERMRLTHTSGGVSDPVWSHDGRYLAFIKHDIDACKIVSLSPLGGPERPLLTLPQGQHPLDPAWSPNGKWLAYAVQDECRPPNGISLLSLETYESKQLTGRNMSLAHDRRPVFSPDGKRLAFIRVISGQTDIYVATLNDTETVRLTRGEHWISDLDWTPDGKHVVFATRQGLWQIPSSGGSAALLVAGMMHRASISVARDTWRLAYEQTTHDMNIWQVPLSGSGEAEANASPLIASTRSDSDPAVSPDGTRITFVSDRSGDPQLWVCDHDGKHARRLTNFEGARIVDPEWSPDNESIAFAADRFGHLDIYVIAARGGEPRRLTTTSANEDVPHWSQDGRWIYFGSDEGKRSEVYKIAVENRRIIQITRDGGYEAIAAPDGTGLYYARSLEDTTEIRRWHPGGNQNEDVLLRLPGGYRPDWSVGLDGIYYSRQNEQCNLTIRFFSFATRQSHTLFHTDKSSFNFAMTSDGQTLLFDQTDRRESDIVLMDNFRQALK